MIMKHSDRIVGIRQLLLGANAQAQSEGCVVGNSLNGLATALIAIIGSETEVGPRIRGTQCWRPRSRGL